MIKLPERYNYVEAYLTLRCNFKCSYCVNDGNGKAIRKREKLGVKEWVNSLNRINFGNIPLTFGGGEPTMYEGFYEILDNLRKDIKINLLTNLQFDEDNFIKRVSPERFLKSDRPAYRAIRASYHVGQTNPIKLIEKSKKLQDSGFSIGIFGLSHPKFINENMKLMELAIKEGLFFFPKDFLGKWNGQFYGTYKYPEGLSGNKKKVECRTRELLIDPSGEIYRCHRDLYKIENPINNITHKNFTIEDKFRICNNYGECNPCDIKLKTNFYLKEVDCQVEIK